MPAILQLPDRLHCRYCLHPPSLHPISPQACSTPPIPSHLRHPRAPLPPFLLSADAPSAALRSFPALSFFRQALPDGLAATEIQSLRFDPIVPHHRCGTSARRTLLDRD